MATIQIEDAERALAQQAYEVFNTYAAVGKDDDISDRPTLQQLQIKHHRWQVHKLAVMADQTVATMVLGIVEEACWELPEAIEANAPDEVMDTLGDVLIYTCATCTDLRLDFMTLARDFSPDGLEPKEGFSGLMDLYKAVGMLSHVIGKYRQRTRGYDDQNKVREDGGAAIARICAAIHWLAFANDWDTATLFEDVLTRVMKRDFRKNKMTGDVEDGSTGVAPSST